MSTKRCYYEVLSVTREAGEVDIKRAYRKMAMKYHPDRNPDDSEAEDRFKEASEAYGVLSDRDKRDAYDRFGHKGVDSSSGYAGGGFDDIFSHFGDILGDIFGGGGGGGRGQRRVRRGEDLQVVLDVDFIEAFEGCKKDVTFERHDVCGTCEGSGAKAGTKPESCGTCNGAGRVQRQQGFFMVQTTCPVCRGAGRVVKQRCGDCDGDAVKRVQRTLSVKVPAGIDNGMRMRVTGEGETGGPGTERGNLQIVVRVAAHERYQRDGSDVHVQQELTFSEAALGVDLSIETLHGEQSVSVPAGTQTGSVLRLRNRGIPRLDGVGHGDQFVTLNVAVPSSLTAAQSELLAQLREAGL